jgi:predicted aspartyl protease
MVRVAGLLACAGAAACATPLPSVPPPVLAGDRRVVLPLGDPFTLDALVVGAEVRGATGATFQEGFIVDCGATMSVIREPLVGRLGLTPREIAQARTVDPLGRTRNLRSLIVSELRFGRLVVRDLHAATVGSDNILGDDVLNQTPWEVDLDHATLTLDAPAWSPQAALARIPIRRSGIEVADNIAVASGTKLTVSLNGHEVALTLDTGAARSALPAALVKELGLPANAAKPVYVGTMQTLRAAASVVEADLALGSVRLGKQTFLVLDGVARDWGVLGLDVLRHYVFRIEPGRWLELRPRVDVRVTAAARMARWPWAPRCPPNGCAVAHVEGSGDDAAIVMTLLADYPARPTSFLWGCAGARTAASGPPLVISVYLPSGAAGQTVRLVPRMAPPSWATALSAGCDALALLDVNPAGLIVTQIGPVSTVMAMRP